eukprot:SAG31_NODE_1220_length_9296_cov_3.409046_13_plen_77_part_00
MPATVRSLLEQSFNWFIVSNLKMFGRLLPCRLLVWLRGGTWRKERARRRLPSIRLQREWDGEMWGASAYDGLLLHL